MNNLWILAIILIGVFAYYVIRYIINTSDKEVILDDQMEETVEVEKEIDAEIAKLKQELKEEQKEPEEVLPPINLDQIIFTTGDEFPEPHMETQCEPIKACTDVKIRLTAPSPIETLIEKAETIESKRKYPQRIKKNSDFDRKLYTIAEEKGKDISVNDMVLWNRKISKVTEIKNKKAYICTVIDGKEVCKNVNISALLKATKKLVVLKALEEKKRKRVNAENFIRR